MKKLTITTIRLLSDQEYTKVPPILVNWDGLENIGAWDFTQHYRRNYYKCLS
jgi:hypothetical protein